MNEEKQKPVAWAVMNGEKPLWVWYDKWDDAPPHAVPLYFHPPVSSSDTFSGAGNHGERGKPALTDEERASVRRASFVCDQTGFEKSAETLRNLLERLA